MHPLPRLAASAKNFHNYFFVAFEKDFWKNLQAYGRRMLQKPVAKSRRSTVRKCFVHRNGLVVKLLKVSWPRRLAYSACSRASGGGRSTFGLFHPLQLVDLRLYSSQGIQTFRLGFFNGGSETVLHLLSYPFGLLFIFCPFRVIIDGILQRNIKILMRILRWKIYEIWGVKNGGEFFWKMVVTLIPIFLFSAAMER